MTDWITSFLAHTPGLSDLSDQQRKLAVAARMQRDLHNMHATTTPHPKSEIDECVNYFRRAGLSSTDIRKSMQRACFELYKDRHHGND